MYKSIPFFIVNNGPTFLMYYSKGGGSPFFSIQNGGMGNLQAKTDQTSEWMCYQLSLTSLDNKQSKPKCKTSI